MSRSFRRTPIVGNTKAASEKHDKRLANRAWRARVRDAIRVGAEPPTQVEVVDGEWEFGKDGKRYLSAPQPEDMRK